MNRGQTPFAQKTLDIEYSHLRVGLTALGSQNPPATPESVAGAPEEIGPRLRVGLTAAAELGPRLPVGLTELPGSHLTVDEQKEIECRREMLACNGPVNLNRIAERLGASCRAEVAEFLEGRPHLLEIIDEHRSVMPVAAEVIVEGEMRAGKLWAGKLYLERKGALAGYHQVVNQRRRRPRASNAATGPAEPRPRLTAEERQLRSQWSQAWKVRVAAKLLAICDQVVGLYEVEKILDAKATPRPNLDTNWRKDWVEQVGFVPGSNNLVWTYPAEMRIYDI